MTFKPFDKVLVRRRPNEKWKIDFFAKYNENKKTKDERPYIVFSTPRAYMFCIPYLGHEHLAGTTAEPQEVAEVEEEPVRFGDKVFVLSKDIILPTGLCYEDTYYIPAVFLLHAKTGYKVALPHDIVCYVEKVKKIEKGSLQEWEEVVEKWQN